MREVTDNELNTKIEDGQDQDDVNLHRLIFAEEIFECHFVKTAGRLRVNYCNRYLKRKVKFVINCKFRTILITVITINSFICA